ncbi:putative cyclic nucleotide-gated ion channel 16 [Citrus sinensis]|uniref:Cyclic nucleotide-gated ion channel 16 n=1 Tax=Citrus sinensis TaxID=2711 RepID=A0ACB8LRV0_CITSI|nr:putative cyclic nucleotide-gated ion channel 16 [Citrus sinensis]
MNTLQLYASSGLTKTLSLGHKDKPWLSYKILEPQSDFVNKWNHIFFVACIIALFLDPLYFYVPIISTDFTCMTVDYTLVRAVTLLRSMVDALFFAHIIVKFRTAFVAPSSRVVGRGDLVRDPGVIARRYLKSDFIVDLVATLPLPQITSYLVIVIPGTDYQAPDHANGTIVLIVFLQYIPRVLILITLNERIMKTAGVIAKISWSGSAFTLLFYMLASHIIGATWYFFSFKRQHACWIQVCEGERNSTHSPSCDPIFIDCSVSELPERNAWLEHSSLYDECATEEQQFPFGIFYDAIDKQVAETNFIRKYCYCLWWGLKNLRRDTEEWMRHRQLPEGLRERVRRFLQYKWLATRGVDEESILQSLPLDLRRTIQRHLCLAFVRRVPFFAQMDQQLLDAICERLYSSLNTRDTYLIREGDPVNEMIFIIRGQVESSTTNGGRAGFYNSITLKSGDFCGEELLTWALMPVSTLNLPLSTRTVKSLTEVEAFALRAEDLKFVASQFKRLHSKRLQHAFRYYSHQWRGWGASFIQAAWRRYKRRKKAVELAIKEGLYEIVEEEYPVEDSAGGAIESGAEGLAVEYATDAESPGTALLAPRLSTKRLSLRVPAFNPDDSSMKMPKLFKPTDPDFSADHHDN